MPITIFTSASAATQRQRAPEGFDFYVCSDNSGEFSSITKAIEAAIAADSPSLQQIYVAEGRYVETPNCYYTTLGKLIKIVGDSSGSVIWEVSGGGLLAGVGVVSGFTWFENVKIIRSGEFSIRLGHGGNTNEGVGLLMTDGTRAPGLMRNCQIIDSTLGLERVALYADAAVLENSVVRSSNVSTQGCAIKIFVTSMTGCQIEGCGGRIIDASEASRINFSGNRFDANMSDGTPTGFLLMNNTSIGQISGNNFHMRHAVEEAMGDKMLLSGNAFLDTKANSYIGTAPGSAILSRNVYSDQVDPA